MGSFVRLTLIAIFKDVQKHFSSFYLTVSKEVKDP